MAPSRIVHGALIASSLLLTAPYPRPVAAQAPPGTRALLRQMYGDVALELRTAPASAIRVAAADGKRVVAMTVLARDLRRWADSAARVLVARPTRTAPGPRWQASLEEMGVQSGSMTLTRTIAGADTTVSVIFVDNDFEGIRAKLDPDEAEAFVSALRRAANAVLSPPKPGRGNAPPTAPRRPPPTA